MISFRWLAVCAALNAALSAAELIPVEDFARAPVFSDMQLSPDGQCLAFLAEHDDVQKLCFSDLGKMKTAGTTPYSAGYSENIISFIWIGDQRVVFHTGFEGYFTGLRAMNRNGRNWKALGGSIAYLRQEGTKGFHATDVIHSFDNNGQSTLILGWIGQLDPGEKPLMDVMNVNTFNATYDTVAKNPGNVSAWAVDHAGHVRLGFSDGPKTDVIYRENDGVPWRKLSVPKALPGEIRPLDFDCSNQKIYVTALSPQKHCSIYLFDPATGTLGDPILEDSEYDVIPIKGLISQFDGIPLSRTVFSQRKQTLAGVYYVTDGPHVDWFDPDYAAYQKNIDAALPRTVNLITGGTRDEKRLLVLAFSDKDPGTCYLFDTEDKSLTRIASRMAWIKPALMATTYPIKYPARDGLFIHGYLTLPAGRPHKDLPMVIMPHGDPWTRDVWGFNPLVQMLANRGYAVLQINYRGTPGYGEDFYDKGMDQIGRGMQDDIEDGARWAVAKNFADPKCLAIIGEGFGGFSVLFALAHNPDLYRCGISVAGVADWPSIMREGKVPGEGDRFAFIYWTQRMGDLKSDDTYLKLISPVNFADKITSPLLLIQGEEDRLVPAEQTHALTKALENAGHPPETLFVARDEHDFRKGKNRIAEYKAIEAFLLKNLGPGAPPEEPAKAEAPAAAPAKPAG